MRRRSALLRLERGDDAGHRVVPDDLAVDRATVARLAAPLHGGCRRAEMNCRHRVEATIFVAAVIHPDIEASLFIGAIDRAFPLPPDHPDVGGRGGDTGELFRISRGPYLLRVSVRVLAISPKPSGPSARCVSKMCA